MEVDSAHASRDYNRRETEYGRRHQEERERERAERERAEASAAAGSKRRAGAAFSPGSYHLLAHHGQSPFAALHAAGNGPPPQQQQQQVGEVGLGRCWRGWAMSLSSGAVNGGVNGGSAGGGLARVGEEVEWGDEDARAPGFVCRAFVLYLRFKRVVGDVQCDDKGGIRAGDAAAAFILCFVILPSSDGHLSFGDGYFGRVSTWGARIRYPRHTLTARWDYVNAEQGGIVQQPQYALASSPVSSESSGGSSADSQSHSRRNGLTYMNGMAVSWLSITEAPQSECLTQTMRPPVNYLKAQVRMDMAHRPRELHLTMHGGRGGDGGQGGGQGGQGGVGEGPIVNFYGDKEEERTKIINWLSPINFFLRHAAISEMREKGTGEWLLKHPLFEKWESGLGNTLWCHGIPSTITNYNNQLWFQLVLGKLSLRGFLPDIEWGLILMLLAGLWRQLVLDKDIGSIAETLYKQHQGKGTAPSLEEVVNVLNSGLEEFSQVFIIVDAMDEYPDFQRKILLKQLAALGTNVNVMITSRPNISADSSSFPNLEILDIQAAVGDIQAFINAQIESSPYLPKHIQRKPELREEILTKVIDTADGMFLLAKLYMQFLSTKNTIGHVREALKEAPKDLYDSYHIALQQIEAQNEDNRKTARSTLLWVANAKRLLTVSELTTALAIKPGARSIDEDYLLDIETVLAVCAGLVTVDKESSVVRLVHYTTQEYLDKIQAEKFPDAQTEMTHTLLTFLTLDGYPDTSWDFEDLPPLAEYSQYCIAHAAGQAEVQLREILLKFLDWAFQWVNRMNPGYQARKWDSKPWNYFPRPSEPSALWIAAAANLVETTRFLLTGAPSLQDSEGSEIMVASYYGHKEIVSLLLEKGANVNATRGYGSALQTAAAGGYTEIVDILLKNGANAAAAGGYTEIVNILLDEGADINAEGRLYGSTLQAAAAGGRTKIVSILLDKGADINAEGGHYGRTLQAAAVGGHTEIVDILLKRGADVNAVGGEYRSALQAAAAYGRTEIVHILLKKGADINAVGGYYGSALQAAAAGGHTKIVSMLLEMGADVNAAGGEYGSALQAAAYAGHTEIVDILLKRGADVNAARALYGSALQAATARDHTEIVYMLLEKGADVNAAEGRYRSALETAAYEGTPRLSTFFSKKVLMSMQ
ncbi:hypothetical protein C8F04DRAFT_1202503 [Mycena alexandri]|uniref:Uncharacterized protein n=1 Tax=Mycena alexandri TaxID=1745969 RepID=A0AAD6RZY7_9AGAR|nr:hypothetical protein C8F04DRAFT_1202503 [Mycena alexandri]